MNETQENKQWCIFCATDIPNTRSYDYRLVSCTYYRKKAEDDFNWVQIEHTGDDFIVKRMSNNEIDNHLVYWNKKQEMSASTPSRSHSKTAASRVLK